MRILIADDDRMTTLITEHSDARFSHGICPACFDKVLEDLGTDAPSPEPSTT